MQVLLPCLPVGHDGDVLGPGIIVPIVIVAIVVPVAYVLVRRRLRSVTDTTSRGPRAVPLTSASLQRHARRPWRVVHEIAAERLGGVEHVVIGPPGVFAVVSVLAPVPTTPVEDPIEIGRLAVLRGEVDDRTGAVGVPCRTLVVIHWGRTVEGTPVETPLAPGTVAVDGHRLDQWLPHRLDALRVGDAPDAGANSGDEPRALTPTQVDLAWRTVTTGIGRPDPVDD